MVTGGPQTTEEIAAALLDAAPDALLVTDGEGAILLVNAQAEALFGYPREELFGKPVETLLPESQRAMHATHRAAIARALASGNGLSLSARRKDGSELPVEVSLSAVATARGVMITAAVRDISARRRTEELLREAEERFRLALDQAPIGTALVGLDGRFLRVNHALCELVGYSAEELTALTFQDITHPDDLEADLALRDKLARGEIRRYQLDKRYIKRGGAVVHTSLTGSVVRGPDGRARYYIAQIEDTTERMRGEAALRRLLEAHRKQARFLNAVVENIPAMVFLKDARTLRFERVNRASEQLLGWPREAMIGKDDYAFFSKEQADHFQADDRETLRASMVMDIAEEPIQTRHGERWLRTMKIPLVDDHGAPTHLLGISVDITRRKEAEHARDATMRWLSAVLDQSPIGMILAHNQAGEQLTLNDAARRLLGLDGTPFVPYQGFLCTPEGTPVPLDQTPLQQALRGQTLESAEFLLRRQDGELVPIIVGASPVRDAEGAILGGAAIAYDETSIKELERLRVEWNSIVAHDLRQPLSTILLQIRLLAAQNKELAALRKPVERINRSVLRLDRMIGDLLDLSRLEASRLSLARTRLDVAALARACLEEVAPLAEDRSFALELRGEAPPVEADPDRISQILHNLLSNAIKYGASGTPIVVAIEAEDGGVSVAITNEGRGIPSEEIPRLFQRFRRTDDARLAGIEGMGLGLFITRSLVEAHGGALDVRSTVGGKTTFRFTLPVTSPASYRGELGLH